MTSGPALKSRLAVFDFDGTLCSRNSYHVLVRDRSRSGLRSCLSISSRLALRKLRLMTSEQLKNVVLAGFRGWPRERLDALGQRLYEQELRPFLRTAALDELERRRAAGFTPILISGAFDFLLHPFCRERGIEVCASTRVAFEGELCLGRLEGAEVRGAAKGRVLRDLYPDGDVDWAGSCAFGDELSDLPVFEMVGEPCLVNSPMRAVPLCPNLRFVAW